MQIIYLFIIYFIPNLKQDLGINYELASWLGHTNKESY